MACHRIEELLALIKLHWEKDPDLNLLQFLAKTGQESGFTGSLVDLTDEILIYQLKMQDSNKDDAIPGIKKDYEDDFKTAILKARGLL